MEQEATFDSLDVSSFPLEAFRQRMAVELTLPLNRVQVFLRPGSVTATTQLLVDSRDASLNATRAFPDALQATIAAVLGGAQPVNVTSGFAFLGTAAPSPPPPSPPPPMEPPHTPPNASSDNSVWALLSAGTVVVLGGVVLRLSRRDLSASEQMDDVNG